MRLTFDDRMARFNHLLYLVIYFDYYQVIMFFLEYSVDFLLLKKISKVLYSSSSYIININNKTWNFKTLIFYYFETMYIILTIFLILSFKDV